MELTNDQLATLATQLEAEGDEVNLDLTLNELNNRGYFNNGKDNQVETEKKPTQFSATNFVDFITGFEGDYDHKDPGGIPTKAYGVFNTMGLTQDQDEDPKSFAVRVADENLTVLKSDIRDFDSQPESVKKVLSSLQWNTGKIYRGIKSAVNDGDYETMGLELLDIVTQSNGPDIPEDEKWVLPGLAKRRAMEYNVLAEEFGFKKITDYKAEQRKDETMITYYSGKAVVHIVFIKGTDSKKVILQSKNSNTKVSIT